MNIDKIKCFCFDLKRDAISLAQFTESENELKEQHRKKLLEAARLIDEVASDLGLEIRDHLSEIEKDAWRTFWGITL